MEKLYYLYEKFEGIVITFVLRINCF